MTTTRNPEPMNTTHEDRTKIDAWTRHLTVAGHPANTRSTYRAALTRAARELPHGLEATDDELADWLSTLRSASARQTYRAALKNFYGWAVTKGGMQGDNPTTALPPVRRRPGLPRPITHQQLAELLAHPERRMRLWIMLAAYAGLRCCEIARLRREDITQEVIYLHGKGDWERAVPTHPDIWAAVQDLPPGPVAGVSAKTVSRYGVAVMHQYGITGHRSGLHRLRHWAGTWWQAATGDVRVTQQLLGHSSPATTAVYTAVSDQQMRAAVAGLPRVTAASGGGSGPAVPAGASPTR